MKSVFLLFQEGVIRSFQDFLFKLDIKPRLHVVEISILPLNNVTVRPTKIMIRADIFLENKIFWKPYFIESWCPSRIQGCAHVQYHLA